MSLQHHLTNMTRPITDDFLPFITTTPPSFSAAFHHFLSMLHHSDTTTLPQSQAITHLRAIVNQHVHLNREFPTDASDVRFPGPMVDMGRSSLPLLSQYEYYVSEKSDGLRCLMLSLHSPHVPRWVYCDDDHSHEPIPLLLNLAMETMFENVKSSATHSTVKLPNHEHLHLQYNTSDHSIHLVNTQNGTHRPMKRTTGYSFTFLIDTKFNFHLLLDELSFPIRNSLQNNPSFHSMVLLDGEIVENLRDGGVRYLMHDVVVCEVDGQLHSFVEEDMEKRLLCMQQEVLAPHVKFRNEALRCGDASLYLDVKTFYRKSELAQCWNKIQRDEVTGEMVYDGMNRNDGLVFTPNAAERSGFRSGTNQYLLKWEHVTTFDFAVVHITMMNPPDHTSDCSISLSVSEMNSSITTH